jgi:hypothetical protein
MMEYRSCGTDPGRPCRLNYWPLIADSLITGLLITESLITDPLFGLVFVQL